MANGLRPFVLDRNIRHFLWYGGVAGDGLRSVGDEDPPLIQERVLYPAHRHLRAGAPTPRRQGTGLRPLYCPWPRWFPIALCAAFTLPGCALREISGDATMTIPGGPGMPYVTVTGS